jgi:hypothetical protein
VGDQRSVREAGNQGTLVTASGISIEVRTAGYLQEWPSQQSELVFSGLTGRTWSESPRSNRDPMQAAEVLVFAAETCREPSSYDPLDLSQWEFRVLPTSTIRPSVRALRTKFLDRHGAKPTRLDQLEYEIARVHTAARSRPSAVSSPRSGERG